MAQKLLIGPLRSLILYDDCLICYKKRTFILLFNYMKQYKMLQSNIILGSGKTMMTVNDYFMNLITLSLPLQYLRKNLITQKILVCSI